MQPNLPQNCEDEAGGASRSKPVDGASSLRALKKRVRYALALPPFLFGLVSGYLHDLRRYYRAASKGHEAVCVGRSRYTELKSWIAADAHKIEKGLALREPRPGFGMPVVRRLVEHLRVFRSAFGNERITRIATNTLLAYCQFNKEHNQEDKGLYAQVAALAEPSEQCDATTGEGGVLRLTRDDILAQSSIPNIENFFSSRYSIRDFAPQPVPISLIEAAARMAQKTPSVCNRQSWKVYAFANDKDVKQVLACQQGNRGFGDLAGAVLIVTSDLATFFSYGERNQAWIDGGMFAMSLIYALHAVGLGSCCLNWSVDCKTDRKLRQLTQIPDNEVVTMLVAVGYLPGEFNVAQSPRKRLDEVLVFRSLGQPDH